MNSNREGILLVEDEEHDTFFMKRALSKAHLLPPIHVAVHGQDAIDYLSGAGRYADRAKYPLPACIFLDLKLPYVPGFEVLEWLREQPSLKDMDVIILTSSPEDSDRQRASELGAKAYLVKPPTPETLLSALALLPGSFAQTGG